MIIRQTTYKYRLKGATLIEILLCLAILSASLYPIAFMLQNFGISKKNANEEFLATLLAHHATETLIAKRSIDPSYVPKISDKTPVVMKTDSPIYPHDYFKIITPNGLCINQNNEPELFKAFERFTLSIDAYLLDTRFFKAICKINYEIEGKTKQIFFERQLYTANSKYVDNNENIEPDYTENDFDYSLDDGSDSDE